MFDSLADQMKHDEQEQINTREKAIRYSVIAVVSVLLFVGLYLAVRMAG
jgi:hypothetical protein